jgi:hypothetical protein
LVGLGARRQSGADGDDELGDDALGDNENDGGSDDDFESEAWRSQGLLKLMAENARLAGEVDALAPEIDTLRLTIETLERRLDELAAQPLPPKTVAGVLGAVSKSEDVHPA